LKTEWGHFSCSKYCAKISQWTGIQKFNRYSGRSRDFNRFNGSPRTQIWPFATRALMLRNDPEMENGRMLK
jgi:hypothetical protein